MDYNEALAAKQEQIRKLKSNIIRRKVAYWSLPAAQRLQLKKHLSRRQQRGKHEGRRPGTEIKLVDVNGIVPSIDASPEKVHQIVTKNTKLYDDCDRVRVDDVTYAVAENGYLLVPLNSGRHLQETSPKAFNVLWRRDVFSLNLEAVSPQPQPRKQQRCRYFGRFGICRRGKSCNFDHDVSTIRLCHNISSMGDCNVKNCLLNHNANNCNAELCSKNLSNGVCLNPDCHRSHHKPPLYDDPKYEIWVCRPFAVGGYCQRGSKCPFMHYLICPEYEENGRCSRSDCSLKHIDTYRHQAMMVNSKENDGNGVFIQDDRALIPVNSYSTKWEKLFLEGDTFDVEFDDDINDLEVGTT
ncbi:hypothetical protein DIRU0_E52020 [Diutina rugosa]